MSSSHTDASSAAQFRIGHYRLPEALVAVAPAWRELAQRSGQGPLVGPDWIAAHVAAHQLASRFHLLAAEDSDGITALLPLVKETGWIRGLPVSMLRGAVGLTTLRFDLVAEPGPRGRAGTSALCRHLLAWQGWTCLELQPVPRGGVAECLQSDFAGAGYRTLSAPAFSSPRISLAQGFEAALAVPKSHFRSNLRRNRRRLEGLGRLRMEAVATPSTQDMEAFFTLEAAGWKGHERAGRAVLVRPEAQRRFYLLLAANAGAQGALQLHRLWLGDRIIAASLGMIGAGTYYAVKWCYDESLANYGPGHILIEALLRECAGMGLTAFDFTGPDYEYKREWTPEALEHRFLFIFRPHWRGAMLHWWKRLRVPGR